MTPDEPTTPPEGATEETDEMRARSERTTPPDDAAPADAPAADSNPDAAAAGDAPAAEGDAPAAAPAAEPEPEPEVAAEPKKRGSPAKRPVSPDIATATMLRLVTAVLKAGQMPLIEEDPSVEGENPFDAVGPSPALSRVEYKPVIDPEKAKVLAAAIEKAATESNFALIGSSAIAFKTLVGNLGQIFGLPV